MSNLTSIEWTELSWNPTTGCTKISDGCKYCYAETMAKRLQAMGVKGYENGFKFTMHPARLSDPLFRKKPSIFFVNSMSDLFHEDMPEYYLDEVMTVMEKANNHIFQILTKRADRAYEYLKNKMISEHIWIGVTVENKSQGKPRIDYLRNIPAATRFISMEPLLEDLGCINLTNIDWIIVGGESGPKARPMKPDWVINIKKHCEFYNAKFFFKQWGSWGSDGIKRSKKANGRIFLGKTWDDIPKYQRIAL